MNMNKSSLVMNITKVLAVLILVVSFIQLSELKGVEAAKKVKEYPLRDKELPTYKNVEALPDIIYNTPASKNGLNGNCYYIVGKVKGVYNGFSKLCKALKIKRTVEDKDDVTEKTTYILIKTDKGYVVVSDMYSYVVESVLELFNSGEYPEETIKPVLDAYIEKYVYYEPYKELPKKGEKVKVFATYSGFSNVTKTPVFYYGINQLTIDGFTVGKTVDLNPETKTFKFDNIKMEIPKGWAWQINDDVYKYFYCDDGFVMVTSSYLNGYKLNDYIVDTVIDSLLNSKNMSLKHTSTKKNEYKNKTISEYYILQFKGKKDGEKCKIRMTLFEYKGDLYTVAYYSNLTEQSDDYFTLYNNIIKSIKILK